MYVYLSWLMNYCGKHFSWKAPLEPTVTMPQGLLWLTHHTSLSALCSWASREAFSGHTILHTSFSLSLHSLHFIYTHYTLDREGLTWVGRISVETSGHTVGSFTVATSGSCQWLPTASAGQARLSCWFVRSFLLSEWTDC